MNCTNYLQKKYDGGLILVTSLETCLIILPFTAYVFVMGYYTGKHRMKKALDILNKKSGLI